MLSSGVLSDLSATKTCLFFRIPTIRIGRSQREFELSTKRRVGWLAAISRDDLSEYSLKEGRVCSRHFISGKPASLFDELHPDWLPTQNLGHSKVSKERVQACEKWYRRTKARVERQTAAIHEDQSSSSETETHIDTASPTEVMGVDARIQTEETADDIYCLRTELNI